MSDPSIKSESMRSQVARLQKRLVVFAVRILNLAELLPNTKAGNHVSGQLIRCGTSLAPNYAEAQSAESQRDFVHKVKIGLKELRETEVWLMIVDEKGMISGEVQEKWDDNLPSLMKETDELIAIFVSSVNTVNRRGRGQNKE